MNSLKIRPYVEKYSALLASLQRDEQAERFTERISEAAEYLDAFAHSNFINTSDYEDAVDAFDDALKNHADYCTNGLRGRSDSLPRFTAVQQMSRIIMTIQKDLLDRCPPERIALSRTADKRRTG